MFYYKMIQSILLNLKKENNNSPTIKLQSADV